MAKLLLLHCCCDSSVPVFGVPLPATSTDRPTTPATPHLPVESQSVPVFGVPLPAMSTDTTPATPHLPVESQSVPVFGVPLPATSTDTTPATPHLPVESQSVPVFGVLLPATSTHTTPATPNLPAEPTWLTDPSVPVTGDLSSVTSHLKVTASTALNLTPASSYKTTNAVIHVTDISPLPVISIEDKNKKRKSRATHAADLTSTPYKKQLESMPVNVKRSAARKLICETEEKKKVTRKRKIKLSKQELTKSNLPAEKQKKSSANKKQKKRSAISLPAACLSTDETPCSVCNRKYNEPPLEEWQQCPLCAKWYHDSCGPDDTDVCYFCLQ